MVNKRRRRKVRVPRLWQYIGAGALAVAVAVVVVITLNREYVDPDVIARANERIAAESAAERAERQAEDEARAEAAKLHVPMPADGDLSVLYIGDSVTQGAYASQESLTWPSLVTAGLSQTVAVTPTVSAQGGYTAELARTVLVPDANFDMVVVEFGNNDMMKTDMATFSQSYPALLDDLKAKSPDASLLCVSPFLARTSASEMNTIQQEACEARGGKFVQIGQVIESPARRSVEGTAWFRGTAGDNGHPNDAGHRDIADIVLAHIVLQ